MSLPLSEAEGCAKLLTMNNSTLSGMSKVVYESQLGKQIPGIFGPKDVIRAIAEAGSLSYSF